MSNRTAKEVKAQFEAAVFNLCAEPTVLGTFRIALDPTDMYLWWVCISGINKEFSGEYIFALTCQHDDKFLADPPHFKCYTPNGSIGILLPRVCISIGAYHKQNYRCVIGIGGFAAHIAAALIESAAGTLGTGIELLTSTTAERIAFAATSRAYNRANNKIIMGIIEEAQDGNAQIIARRNAIIATAAVTAAMAAASIAAGTPVAIKTGTKLFGAAAKRAAIAALTTKQ